MYNYNLRDVNGKVLGVISLETEELPKAMADGAHFAIGVTYRITDKKVVGMTVVPLPLVPRD